MSPIKNKNPCYQKKQTGTVPKLPSMYNNVSHLARDMGLYSNTPSLPSSSPSLPQQQQPQQQQQQLKKITTKITTVPNKSKPSSSYRSGVGRKNTEIVAPTRRELNDLNDYLLIASVNADSGKQQNSNHNNGQHHVSGIHSAVEGSGQQQLEPSCYDVENINFQESQRFCYPVRPIPRRSNKKQQEQQNIAGEQNLSTSNNSSTAVGVVIPTTPANSIVTTALQGEDNFNLLGGSNISRVSSNTTYQNIFCDPQTFNGIGPNQSINHLPTDINCDLTWEERLNFIQYFLSVTSKLNNPKGSINQYKMVNETRESNRDDILVNSTSLEDVALSESSDRAHSVSSIHTLSGAEPSTPNYEELQHRLESSNRNIQNIKDQQQQLLRLQQTAKQHLSDMEDVRSQMPIRINGSNENGAPDYESVEQVHNDMSALVNRMRNLQTFIQNQNELSALLGEDSPDLLAEQELLQQKLNELKSHRTEMRSLVDELQNINTNAEKSLAPQQEHQKTNQEKVPSELINGDVGVKTQPTTQNRVVPVEYQRVVPIELVGAANNKARTSSTINNAKQDNSHTDTEDDNDVENDEMDPEMSNMIEQKVADINQMKKQLQRLKDMMMTVKLIEEKTEGPSVKEIGRENVRSSSKPPIEVPASLQKDFIKNVKDAYDNQENHENGQTAEEAAMSERVRLLHEMTDDLRNQALSLTSERDRLKILREELKRRRDFETVENKNSSNKGSESDNTLNNTSNQKCGNAKPATTALELEYEEKKKEFQRLCERLQSEEDQNDETATVTGNEDNEELDNETINQDVKQERNFYAANWQRNENSTSCNSSINQEKNPTTNPGVATASSSVGNTANILNTSNRGKDSADSGAADVHGNGVTASMEAGSVQSGSSRSFSMPPPMRSINNPVWRKNSHEHAQSHTAQSAGCEHYMTGMWNPYQMFPNPYGYMHFANCPQPNGNGEYNCANHTWNNLGVNNTPATNLNPLQNTNDPTVIQQFIHTQQMLMNSICQCNQILWHQQREINTLNNTVNMLQERILNSTPDMQTLQSNQNRAESVPPLAQNNILYSMGMNRAQSEQPLLASVTVPGPLYSNLQQPQQQQQYLTSPLSPNRHYNGFNYNTSNNYSQQQHQRRQLIQNSSLANGGAANYQSMTSATSNLSSNYNFSAENTNTTTFQNQPAAVGGHVAFNNAQPMNFLNNDPSHQTHQTAGPIFMHHHNNNIGGIGQQHTGNINNSNSNMLHQNATNSASVTTTAAGALNNQVAPGTRANNYWDNFRSYSRQNLLSSNSCKSNEELNHQMQLQHLQQQQVQQLFQQQQQQQVLQTQINNTSTQFNLSPIQSANNINIQNESRSLSSISGGIHTSSTNLSLNLPNTNNINQAISNSNNLNPSNYDNKYFNTFRNEFNSNNHQLTNVNAPGLNQPINLSTTSNINSTVNTNSSIHVEPCENISSNLQAISTEDPVTLNSNLNGIQHLEVNQGGSASSNLSVAQSDNLNENIFDFNTALNLTNNNNININNTRNLNSNIHNNTHANNNNNININNNTNSNNHCNNNNINSISNNNNNVNYGNNINNNINNTSNVANLASIFDCPDFRNMNFNFGLHEPKKVPIKTACTPSVKRFRHTQNSNNNSNNSTKTEDYNCNTNNSGIQSNLNTSINNNDQYRYEEMSEGAIGFDETSEEIKRNLLVNALKSDKFTSKFFESLKEDVYRQAYAIIQEKKSDPQFLAQLFEEIKGAPVYDPLRNLLVQSFYNLNSSTDNQQLHHRTNNDTESNDGDNEMENEESGSAATAEAEIAVAVASLTGNGIQNFLKVEDKNSTPHSISSQTYLKYNQQTSIANDEMFQRNTTPNITNNDIVRDSDVKPLFYNAKDYKFPHDKTVPETNNGNQQKNKTNDLRNEKVNARYHIRNFGEPRHSNNLSKKRPEAHVISYTIFKIRKEIQKQQIDDATLVKIVKITIQTLEDAISNLQQPSPILAASLRSLLYRIKLSTKDIYSKMKNFQNQDKESFFQHFQSYLNRLMMEDTNNINLAKTSRNFGEAGDIEYWLVSDSPQLQNKTGVQFNNQMSWNQVHNLPKHDVNYKSNLSPSISNEAKVMNSSDNQNAVHEIFLNLNQQNVHTSHRHQQNHYQHEQEIGSPCTSSNNIMNEDLAEADQICSANNPMIIRNIEDAATLINNKERNASKIEINPTYMNINSPGAVGYSNIHSSNSIMEIALNDQDIVKNNNIHEINDKSCGDLPHSDDKDYNETVVIDCCDNENVEDDQVFPNNIAAITAHVSDLKCNDDATRDKHLKQTSFLCQNRKKIFKNNNKKEKIENLADITQVNNDDIDSLVTHDNNSRNSAALGIDQDNCSGEEGASNNACAYVFPIRIQTDCITNNLDSGYQSLPQPDSGSSLSNSKTESVESNISCPEFRNMSWTKRNSVS